MGQMANQQSVVQILPKFQADPRATFELRKGKSRETNKDNKLPLNPDTSLTRVIGRGGKSLRARQNLALDSEFKQFLVGHIINGVIILNSVLPQL